jgi:hypothetical protein
MKKTTMQKEVPFLPLVVAIIFLTSCSHEVEANFVIGERIYHHMWGSPLSDFILRTETTTFVLVHRPQNHTEDKDGKEERTDKRKFVLECNGTSYTDAEITFLFENIKNNKMDNIILQYFYREDKRDNEGFPELNFKEEVVPIIKKFMSQGISVSGILRTGSRFSGFSFYYVKQKRIKEDN